MRVCVSVRYRTHLNVVGMGSKLLGVLRKTLRWSSNSQKFKKLFLKNRVFKTANGRKMGKRTETGNKNRCWGGNETGARKGNGGGNGKRVRPEQRRVPPTSIVSCILQRIYISAAQFSARCTAASSNLFTFYVTTVKFAPSLFTAV
jgi:hypothetical protein